MRKSVLVLFTCLTAMTVAVRSQEMPRRPSSGDAVIWHLGHCGYAVQTANHLLIFDYQEKRDGPQLKSRPTEPALANGWINVREIGGHSVRVFVSHSHADHYDPVILEWRKSVPDVEYFFGWNVSEDSSLHCLAGPNARYSSAAMAIETINSHHSGVPEVAWLVKIDGLVIYHNGDCQPDDPVAAYNHLKAYADRVDVAFVPPTYDEELNYTKQNEELIRRFSPRLMFPMHATAGSDMYREFQRVWVERHPDLSIAIPMRMGEWFAFRGAND
jgi:L-ascorbate metabolism protein UlaG (beta-lactamase superfamily)